jgi:hypothetical protein
MASLEQIVLRDREVVSRRDCRFLTTLGADAIFEMTELQGHLVAREGLDTTSQNNSIKTTNCRHVQPHVSCVCDTGVSPFWQPDEHEI